MKNMKRILAVLLALLLITGALTACSNGSKPDASESAAPETQSADEPVGEPITIIFSTNDNETNLQITGIYKPYFEKIEELSEGLVTFEMHYNAELVGVTEALEAVEAGIVDAAFVRASTLGFELDSIVECSYPSNNCNRMSRVYNELYDKYPEMQANYANVQPMFLYGMAHSYLGTTGKEVRLPEDCKGMMLIVSNALQARMVETLGASPVSCPPTEFFSTLEKGVADGSPAPVTASMISDSWAEVCTYVYDMSSTVATAAIVMNKDTFAKLPQACQDYILNSRYEWADFIDGLLYKEDVEGIEYVKEKYGTTYVTPTAQELAIWDEALANVLPDYAAELDAKGLPGSDFLADYMELTRKYAE